MQICLQRPRITMVQLRDKILNLGRGKVESFITRVTITSCTFKRPQVELLQPGGSLILALLQRVQPQHQQVPVQVARQAHLPVRQHQPVHQRLAQLAHQRVRARPQQLKKNDGNTIQ